MVAESVPPRIEPHGPAPEPRETPAGHRPSETKIRDVMTTRLCVTTPSTTLLEAARSMRSNHVSGLPVVDEEGRAVGILSEKDILKDLDRAVGIGHVRGLLDLLLEFQGSAPVTRLETCLRRLEGGRVREAMSTPVVFTTPESTVGEASRQLRQFHIKRLPVVASGHLIGIVTRENLLEALAAPARPEADPAGPWSRHATVPRAPEPGAPPAP